MATTNQQIKVSALPDLPSPSQVYDPSYFNQLNGMLRLYFTKISEALKLILGVRGGKYLNMPYGAVQRNTDFNFSAANTATLVTCTTEDYLNGMTLDTSDGLHVVQSGIYNYQFSVQMANTDSQAHAAYIWLRKNGTDIVGTGSKFDVPAKHGSSDGYLIAACNFYVDLDADDHVEMWAAVNQYESGSTDGVYFEAYTAQTSPFAMPTIPSVVVTLSFVSNKVV